MKKPNFQLPSRVGQGVPTDDVLNKVLGLADVPASELSRTEPRPTKADDVLSRFLTKTAGKKDSGRMAQLFPLRATDLIDDVIEHVTQRKPAQSKHSLVMGYILPALLSDLLALYPEDKDIQDLVRSLALQERSTMRGGSVKDVLGEQILALSKLRDFLN